MSRKLVMTLSGGLESSMVRVSPKGRPRLRSNYLICYIDVSALLGVLIVLLIIFMCPTADLPRGPAADLAKVGSPVPMHAALKEDAMIVAIERDGGVYFRTEHLAVEELPECIRDGVRHGAENRVYIKADARAKYGTVKKLIDAVRASGVEKIGFLVDERKTAPPLD